jgi:hypothetical protein
MNYEPLIYKNDEIDISVSVNFYAADSWQQLSIDQGWWRLRITEPMGGETITFSELNEIDFLIKTLQDAKAGIIERLAQCQSLNS